MQPQLKKKTNWLLIVIIVLAVFLLIYLTSQPDTSKRLKTSEYKTKVEAGEIQEVYLYGRDVYLLTKDSAITSENFPAQYDYYSEILDYNSECDWLETARNNSKIATYDCVTPTQSFFDVILPYLIFGVFSVILLVIIMRVMNKSNSAAMGFGKSRARLVGETRVTFADVAGCDEEKQELKEIVDFLRNPQKFISLGARIPKGFLLVGPPGTGKTLLARAVAGESNVPFYSITGSDFVEMFVGVGASRVRSLFEQAKKTSPCIVFIDEIDAVGRQRGTGLGGGNDEREQTLNQLLVEMDGFEPNSGIVVMAATNRSDVLDPALLRPGRFDRQIYVYPPDVKGREAILKVHARNKPLDKKIDFKTLARLTTGFTGADIEMLLNESAILAARENRMSISMPDLLEAINKVIIGPQKKSRVITESDKKITAYHESGHAIIGKVVLKDANIQEVSIIPRGGAGGYTLHRPETDDTYQTVNKLTSEIIMTMGGRAAEIIKLKDFTTGASADIKHATALARKMVTEWGMSKLGPVAYGGSDEYFLGRDYQVKAKYSEKVASNIDEEISKIINNCLNEAIKILKEHDTILENMTQLLLIRETIFTEEIEELMKGKTAKQISKSLSAKENKTSTSKKEDSKELEKIKNERLQMQKQQEIIEAAQFLENAGLIKIEAKRTNKEQKDKSETKIQSRKSSTKKDSNKDKK